MTIDEAISTACANVAIKEPRLVSHGRWIKTDTLKKGGKGDGRVMVHERSVTAMNWQTGEKSTAWLNGAVSLEERREMAREIEADKKKSREQAARTADLAQRIIQAASASHHLYLIGKGFPEQKALVISAAALLAIVGPKTAYLVPDGASHAVVVPARIGSNVSSVQLIWEDGTKKFLFGGTMEGASHRIGTGVYTWLCEGFATGLSVRAALLGMKIQATVLCCFSASNLLAVARQVQGRAFIAADNDKPLPHYGNCGTGEYFAKGTSLPYGMPPEVKTDFNDLHQDQSIFAVQRILTSVMAQRSA